VGTENDGITGEIGEITPSNIWGCLASILDKLDELGKRMDHYDEVHHDIAQYLTEFDVGPKVTDIHAEVQAAKPLIERWQHSALRKLASGHMPWT